MAPGILDSLQIYWVYSALTRGGLAFLWLTVLIVVRVTVLIHVFCREIISDNWGG